MASFVLTGAANGIGKEIVRSLARDGWVRCTLVDVERADVEGEGGAANIIQGDVVNPEDNDRAFASHVARFGPPAAVVLNAGVGESGDFPDLRCLNVNLIGVMHGIAAAMRHGMESGGTIAVVASAGGLWPMPYSPTYSTAKAAVVMLVRSMAPSLWRRHQVRLIAICPQFVDTKLGRAGARFQKEVSGMLDVRLVADTVADMVRRADANVQPGDVYALMSQGSSLVRRVLLDAVKTVPVLKMPKTFKKVAILEETHVFRRAARVVEVPGSVLEAEATAGKVIVKNLYCGINASDVNFSAGKYGLHPPMDAGFEASGVVVRDDSGTFRVGQPLAFLHYGSFSEYVALAPRRCFKVHRACREVVALLTSGLTASIALESSGIKPGDIVLITAAAGGTGQFFVQLAKEMGAYVVATCGGPAKAAMLEQLGADLIIDYKRGPNEVRDVLRSRFPRGVNVVIEMVGGDMFDTCRKALAGSGRLLIIGAMSQYASGWKTKQASEGLVEQLLAKNQSLIGFFLLNHSRLFKRHFEALEAKWRAGTLNVQLAEPVAPGGGFVGIDRVFDAVDFLQGGKSSGKVTLALVADASSSTPSTPSTRPATSKL